MANYSFVIDSHFDPFSMQEMLIPFTAYKDAFEKSEEAYKDLSDKSDSFKYLSKTLPEDSKARKLYEGYANDLAKQAEDLAHNGLTMGNRRALTSMKRRYQGEIGRIMQADEAMKEEKKLRQSLNAQDSSRLYATDNLSIDDFLDGSNPNLYSISGNELYTRGAAAGKAASSRMTQFGEAGSLLGGLYKDIVQRNGYGQKAMQEFMNSVESIPELAAMVDNIMNASGASENLTGVNRGRARQNIINGMFDGAIYQEQHNPIRDANVLDAMQKNQLDLQRRGQNISLASQGFTYNDKTGTITYDINKDPSLQKASAIAQIKANGKKGSSGSSTENGTQMSGAVKLSWHGNNPQDLNGDADDDVTSKPLESGDGYPGRPYNYNDLPTFVKNKVDELIGDGNYTEYDFYYQPFERHLGGLWDDTETEVAIVPRKTGVKRDTQQLDFGIHEP